MREHEIYMERCLQLAANGLGMTYPNPIVGSVIVHEGKIIGEGWHRKSGEAHAEVNAVNSVKDKSLLKKATIYVTLEPCSHFGKTPPCCDLIIANEIPNVVVGCVDPNEKVAGKGVAKLLAAGKNVIVGILENKCIELNRRFFTFQNKKRPYVILKWAQSRDGFLGPTAKDDAKPVWLTNSHSRQIVHKWRTQEHAILVGTQTAIDDNPALTARDWFGKNPIRIVLDRSQRIPKENHIFDNQAKTIAFSEAPLNGVETEVVTFDENLAARLCKGLSGRDIQSVIVEGGSRLLQTFIDAGIWDEARVFKSDIVLGDGTKAPVFAQDPLQRHNIFGDELLIFRNYDQHDNL
ncbi:bifunctional diaminohydroxyphosphoribosylaminopyrimidine deaminase/5-amino-6-(5-phosphoribosylamino)uracil reductase RibD [Flavobacterium selenitireducens]|uniref:bifunctional diaminohydroxyphosphoribosylaminopyrimidine deaminase/5-amino-6-(5-phosphoribosylamino)uracil reductase RibD n=1 Tax=Flavobacterium selenitireducens TaxID=2722704 RepID=UPI00168B6AFC|nr:bifunctional diaminohydroxyphosphoribosylaminopyrimidine deaminase/5-amino-6-(5-phosphoribosylamino)uracil reductase RibD [Flavobacterium selenitireducens]MBD3582734.1 bifunctional diaminohydroxyphosphoribosylaminopyrimidine deaminase/5-amino-6-(5-phosphoribosylamino)uracil reductase RibD [Flavobacterium selenitireducens]